MNPIVHITISYGVYREKSQSKAFEISETAMRDISRAAERSRDHMSRFLSGMGGMQEYQQAIDKRAEFADYIGRIAANEVLKILGSNDVMDGYKISELPKQLHPIESFSDLLGPVETIEQQTLHSDQIFTAISTGDFCSYADAEAAVLMLYVPDMSCSRSGISHALTRLEKHYSKGAKL